MERGGNELGYNRKLGITCLCDTYVLADNQTNRPYSFLKRAYKILQKPKHRKLNDEKYYEGLIFFKFCQLSISCEIYSSQSRISPVRVLRQNRNKTETRLWQMENFF